MWNWFSHKLLTPKNTSPLPASSVANNTLQTTDNEEFVSSTTRVHLLELYSSEGCSSCPPADHWFAALRKRSDLWSDVVPVAFQVDYWNRLGWTDSLSKAEYSARQYRLAKHWKSNNVYTPEFVLDGQEWRRPSSSLSFNTSTMNVGVLRARRLDGLFFQVSFELALPPSSSSISSYDIYGALLGNGISRRCIAGENIGALLQHEFAVISLEHKRATNETDNTFTATIELSAESKAHPTSYSVAFWVTAANSLVAIQAVGGDILRI